MEKHTKTEWGMSKIANDHDQYIIYDVNTDKTICHSVNGEGHARLIKAVPDLLEGATRLLKLISSKLYLPDYPDGFLNAVSDLEEAVLRIFIEDD